MAVATTEQVVVLEGRLDVLHTGETRDRLHAAVAGGTGVLVVDLGRVESVDAAGLGVLLGTHRLATRSGRRLVLREVPPRLGRLLRATGLARVLTEAVPG